MTLWIKLIQTLLMKSDAKYILKKSWMPKFK